MHFLLIGDGEKKENVKELKRKLKLENVELLNPIPKKDMPSYYAKADAFIVIEKKVSFGFPNKLIDYLICGKPIILATPNKYVVEKFQCTWKADPEKPEEIADCILEVFSLDNNQKKNIMQSTLNYVMNYHNIKNVVDNIEKTF